MRLFRSFCVFPCPLSRRMNRRPGGGGRGGRGGPGSNEPINESTFSTLKARQIGPAFVSGRISQIAVFPDDSNHYLIALASGNIFATTNNGTTWTPVFDNYGSYSIGWITIDPKNPSIVWVGTGENNNQRSVSYGDGVYKSEDGGRTFRNVGLKLTEHIARIVVDPRDSNVVYVAAPGPLWKGGGERGLYKTTDGGKTWSARPDQGRRLHRLQRRHHGPAQSRYSAGRHPPAAAPLFRHDPRRSGKRALPLHRRRQDLDPGARRFPHRRPRPHRPQPGADQSQHHLRAGGRPGGPRRHLPLHRQRRHLGKARQLSTSRASIIPRCRWTRRIPTASTS